MLTAHQNENYYNPIIALNSLETLQTLTQHFSM